MPFTHISLQYFFCQLFPGFRDLFRLDIKYIYIYIFHAWILFSSALVLILSPNMLKGWTSSWDIYSHYQLILIIGSLI